MEIVTIGRKTTQVINFTIFHIEYTGEYIVDNYTVSSKKVKFKLIPKPSKEKEAEFINQITNTLDNK